MRSLARLCSVVLLAVLGACGGASPTTTPRPSAPAPTPTAAPTPTVAHSPSPSPFEGPPRIELVVNHPVLEPSALGDGHYGAILSAAYLTDGNRRHAYVVGFGDARGDQRVFHITSPDGIDWTVDPTDAFAELGLDLSPPGPIPGSILPDRDGGWLMYLWGVPSPQTEGAVIWRATSESVAGPWVADPEPVLELGPSGNWDDRGLDFPAVIDAGDSYVMLYSGIGFSNPDSTSIGQASSVDGVNWERLGEPVVEAALCGGNVAPYAAGPRVVARDRDYLMLFDSDRETYAATSGNTLSWTCPSRQALLTADDIPNSEGIHTFAAAYVDGAISVLIESLFTDADGKIGSQLWLGEVRGL